MFKHIFCISGILVLLGPSNVLLMELPALEVIARSEKTVYLYAVEQPEVMASPCPLWSWGFPALVDLYPGWAGLGAGAKLLGRRGLPQSTASWPYTRPCCDSNGSISIFCEITLDSQTLESMSSRSHFMNHPKDGGRLCWPGPGDRRASWFCSESPSSGLTGPWEEGGQSVLRALWAPHH